MCARSRSLQMNIADDREMYGYHTREHAMKCGVDLSVTGWDRRGSTWQSFMAGCLLLLFVGGGRAGRTKMAAVTSSVCLQHHIYDTVVRWEEHYSDEQTKVPREDIFLKRSCIRTPRVHNRNIYR